MDSLDITTQIKAIERLKCELLTDLAALYESLRTPARVDGNESLASLLINVYLLARRLGLNFEKLNEEAVYKLRREILNGAGAEKEQLIKFLGAAVQ
jgi:hypothetical protein